MICFRKITILVIGFYGVIMVYPLQAQVLKEEKPRELARWISSSDEDLKAKVTGVWDYYGISINGKSYYSVSELEKPEAVDQLAKKMSRSNAAFAVVIGKTFKGACWKFFENGKAELEGPYTWEVKEGKMYIQNGEHPIEGAHLKVTDELLLIGEEVPYTPLVYYVFKKQSAAPSELSPEDKENRDKKLEYIKKRREAQRKSRD